MYLLFSESLQSDILKDTQPRLFVNCFIKYFQQGTRLRVANHVRLLSSADLLKGERQHCKMQLRDWSISLSTTGRKVRQLSTCLSCNLVFSQCTLGVIQCILVYSWCNLVLSQCAFGVCWCSLTRMKDQDKYKSSSRESTACLKSR